MFAMCVPWYVPHGNTGLSKHGNPVFPHFCPVNQNLSPCSDRRGGGTSLIWFSPCTHMHTRIRIHIRIHMHVHKHAMHCRAQKA